MPIDRNTGREAVVDHTGTRLGVCKGGRVRPSYVIPVRDDALTEAFYPKTNRKRLAGGQRLAWKLDRWNDNGDVKQFIKDRWVYAAVFDDAGVVCFIEFSQIKNTSKDWMSTDSFASLCDDLSQSLYEQSTILVPVIELHDRELIYEEELFCEVSSLFIAERAKGLKVWAEAIEKMLIVLAGRSGEDMLCILKAEPLELCWQRKPASGGREERVQPASPAEQKLAARRRRSLLRLYEAEIGFVPLDGHEGWMYRYATDLDLPSEFRA